MFTYTVLTSRPPKLRLPRKLGKIKMAKIDNIFFFNSSSLQLHDLTFEKYATETIPSSSHRLFDLIRKLTS